MCTCGICATRWIARSGVTPSGRCAAPAIAWTRTPEGAGRRRAGGIYRTGSSMVGMDRLFERGRELDELDAHFARSAAGEGRLVVVEGPAGIGKSRLLAEIRRRAEGSMRVLSARGSGLEGEFAFGVVRQLFEAELTAPARREELLAGAAASAAVVFGEPGSGTDGAGATFASLHGLYWLVLNLAEDAPLLLAVDDLHWCDRPS